MYEVTIKLEDVLHNCNDWLRFCREKGYDEYVVSRGGGELQVTLNKEEIIKYGLL